MATQQQLTEAQDALHALMCGRQVVKFRDSNGEEVTYTQATVRQLQTYIAALTAALDTVGTQSVQPIRFWF